MTLRALRVRVQHLPPGGPYYRAVAEHGWTEEHFLLADLFDAVQNNTAAVYRTVAGRKRVPSPRRYPRPGDVYDRPLGDRGDHTTGEVVAYLDSLKPAKGA